MNTNGYVKKYSLEFLVVFLGILSSFGIDNYIKNVQKVNEKNTLLDELHLSINEDLKQLEIVNGALDDCLNSINLLFEQTKEKTLNDSLLAYHISNVSAKVAISFFPQKGVYNQLVNTNSFELIEDRQFRRKISDLYEHLEDRKNAADLKFDMFAESFDKALLDKLNYRVKIEELDNSVSINTIIYDYRIPQTLFEDSEFLGYLSNAEKRVYFYKELMKKYNQSMSEISIYLKSTVSTN
jgi:DNA repair ATPase RecN